MTQVFVLPLKGFFHLQFEDIYMTGRLAEIAGNVSHYDIGRYLRMYKKVENQKDFLNLSVFATGVENPKHLADLWKKLINIHYKKS